MYNFKNLLKNITPPFFINLAYRYNLLTHVATWMGDYKSWDEATNNSRSYNSQEIFNKVMASSIKVRDGEKAYERDSVLFSEIEYSWPLLSSLLWIHAKDKKLSTIDFGGALGSSWHQNKRFLSKLPSIEWKIVEQQDFVEIGKKEFQKTPLSFHYSISEAMTPDTNTVLLAGTLGYLEDPWNILDNIIDTDITHLIIDRTLVHNSLDNKLTIQTVRPPIYTASYPCWILSEEKLLQKIEEKYERIEVWRTDYNMVRNAHFIGGLWVRRTIST